MLNNPLFKIINPVWYFNIKSLKNKIYWVDHKKINPIYNSLFNKNNNYESEAFNSFDIAFQLWHRGLIDIDDNHSLSIDFDIRLSIYDQYLFLRRMYSPKWVYYTILIRILSLTFSFKDIKAIFKTWNIQQISLNKPYCKYDNFKNYKSRLVIGQKSISIILPTLNRYSILSDALKDLENQTYKNFEVLIIDQSNPFNPDFYKKYKLNIKLFHQKERALWKARNFAIKESKNELILLFDDDSRVEPDWIVEHLKCLDFFNADISSGVSISRIGGTIPTHYNYFRWSDQLDTGNVLIKREVFKKCGLFDLQFERMRMGDGEFGLRAYLSGFKNINNPKAKRIHLKAEVGGLREMGSWDGLRPKNWFFPRPIPSVLYFYRKYWGNNSAVLYLLQNLPTSLSSYKLKGTKMGYSISFFLMFMLFPFILLQVFRSWSLSNKMLKKGQLIEHI